MSLLTVGTVAFDALKTPFGKTDKILGGSAAYIGLSASNFVDKVNIVSVVGEDFPQEYITMMEKHGINTRGLQIKKGKKTFFWSGKYHNDMNTRDTADTQLNVLENFDPVIPEEYQNCKYLMLGNLFPMVQKTVIERMKNRPKLIVMDTMNFWMDMMMPQLKETLKLVDVLSINDEEARQLSEDYSLVKAAKKIMAMGPKYLIIKKGEHGALLFHENEVFFAPALPLEDVFDPTGAGDTFAGGFIGYLAATDDISFDNMKRALIHGSALASFSVEKFGTERMVELTEEEVEERIKQFVDLVQFDIQMENTL
ncbi:MAG: sugar/nucleoside kinase (ribokinase family) [Vicingaceae bacterium]|jgi:sugar/nucleoside kinase (ribokinase family)